MLASRNKPTKSSFEGWYYRATNPISEFSISFIPGIAYSPDDSHAFIQVLQSDGRTDYVRYPVSAYSHQEHPLKISVGQNIFTADSMEINLSGKQKIKGKLNFTNFQKPKFKFESLGLMGPFKLLPFLPCYHQVNSLSHTVNGSLLINEETKDFTSTIGYIEQDQGNAFPKGYFWTQCNTFKEHKCSFSCAVAHIPIASGIVGGYALLYTPKSQYNFTTWKGLSISRLEFTDQKLYVQLKQQQLTLDLKISLPDNYTSDLPALLAPVQGVMQRDIKETLSAEIEIALWHKGLIIETIHGKLCAVEIIDLFELINMLDLKK